MVENRWAGFDITGNKEANTNSGIVKEDISSTKKITPASSEEEKIIAFQKVIDYASSLGITFKGCASDTEPMMQENCVIYTLDVLGCMARGLPIK